MFKAYKTELDASKKQITMFMQHLGCARWAYNWGLAKKIEAFEKDGTSLNSMTLHKELVVLKKTNYPWFYESSKCAPQNALRDLDMAYKNFFRRCKEGAKAKGFPKFKTKHDSQQAFRLQESILVQSNYIKLPRIGEVKLKEADYIPKDCKIVHATVSKRAGKWFVSVLVEEPDKKHIPAKNAVIGVDLGIKAMATCSDGTVYANPKALKNNLKKLKRLHRQLSRKVDDSKNREKAKLKLAKLNYKISNIRKDALHKASSKIVNENQVIVLENLNVSKMLKNHKLAKAICDVGFYEFRRQIEYKAKWYGRQVIFADTFYPSSKLCSCCGWRNNTLTLKDRVFQCKNCDNKIDRDLNASLNLKSLHTGGSSGIYACEEGTENIFSVAVQKQESNFNSIFYI